LFYNAPVTSRLLPVSNVNNNISEALLLLDDPGSGVASYYGQTCTTVSLAPIGGGACPFGTQASQILCTTPTSGCVEFVNQIVVGTATVGSFPNGTILSAASSLSSTVSTATATQGPNVFQVVVSGNTI